MSEIKNYYYYYYYYTSDKSEEWCTLLQCNVYYDKI